VTTTTKRNIRRSPERGTANRELAPRESALDFAGEFGES
jgi:hypothetical protein